MGKDEEGAETYRDYEHPFSPISFDAESKPIDDTFTSKAFSK